MVTNYKLFGAKVGSLGFPFIKDRIQFNSFDVHTSFVYTVTFGGAGIGVTYATQIGLFYKIGRLCFYSAEVVLTNKGSSVGGVEIQGMPVFSSTPTCNGGTIIGVSNVTFGTQVQLGVGVNSGSTAIELFKSTSGGSIADLQDSDCSNTSAFLVAGFYTS